MKSLKYIVALALAAGLFQACDLERVQSDLILAKPAAPVKKFAS